MANEKIFLSSSKDFEMTIQERLFPATSMPDQDWWQALWPDPDSVVRTLRIEPGMTVVDLGCGDGYFTAAISRQVGLGRVIGFELDPAMLEQAKAACNGMKNCDWMLGDAMELSSLIAIPTEYVLIANTFHGVPDKTALAKEIEAILWPSGRFAIVNWHVLSREETSVLGQPRGPRTELRMSPEQTRAVVEPAGFQLEAVVELPPFHYAAIFCKTLAVEENAEASMAESNNCSSHEEQHNQIQSVYTKLALQPEQEFAWGKGKTNARTLAYAPAWLDALPDSVWESAAAVGNPFALGPLQPDEVVVDIGCGAGADLCIAASLIGKGGQAIGIDLTPAMVDKARDNAERAGLDNIIVYEADISKLPLPDACADRVISNGAINLSVDKMRVFQEIYRILRPRGRLQFADMARLPTQAAETNCDSWADCVAGTLTPARYIELLESAGFVLVEQVAWTGYCTAATTEGATFRAVKP